MVINIQAFKYILRSIPFEIVTDHSALTQIINSKKEPPTMRLKKVMEKLSDYQCTVRLKKVVKIW